MIVVSLRSLRTTDVSVAGGKGANLGELLRAGFAVPDGFVLTTAAYIAAARAAGVDPNDPVAAADRLRRAEVPEEIADAARRAYGELGAGPVAVRSSATAEDLPGASFAGQQDTFLDVTGEDALLDAIRRCWASLWNERAVSYRRANEVDDASVALAVVVQRMVDAAAAGVLFTADPVTGRRTRAVVDAVAGLGEALVAGRVDPDHYAVEAASGEIVERRLTGDHAVLDDARIREVVATGASVAAHFATPQDIEFAVDRGGKLWLVQSRPITTLYPLPDGADPSRELRVYFSANVAQGMFEPFTPMGVQTFRLMSSGFAAAIGQPVADRLAGASNPVNDPTNRLWIDATALLRNVVARSFPQRVTSFMEARSARLFERLADDPRLAARGASRLATLRRIVPLALRLHVPQTILSALRSPDAARERLLGEVREMGRASVPDDAPPAARIDAFERLVLETPPQMFPRLLAIIAAGGLSFAAASRILRRASRPDEMQIVLRGLAHNPTTEMDLALWALSRDARDDAPSLALLRQESVDAIADRYRDGSLPRWLQQHLSRFLERYGHRAVGEIDLGVPRWSEDPRHIIGAVQNYLLLPPDALPPDAQFDRGAREAEAMIATLLSRVHGPRRLLARALLRRVRSLFGAREAPKFHVIRIFAAGRALLNPIGRDLAAAGRIGAAEDIYFLSLAELRRAIGGDDFRESIASRRAAYRRELGRRHIPRLLLSDGTEPENELAGAEPAAGLRGTPASPGVVSAPARVLRTPQGARLEPGEILVAPSTDPGWTPLFLTAGGLVMEMGGMMSHGAVVAREYGIPAVVGVAGATDRIASGQRITVDGSAGTVTTGTEERA